MQSAYEKINKAKKNNPDCNMLQLINIYIDDQSL